MYKLIIVDDEPGVLKGLCDFDWSTLDIQCIGVCSHGIEALKLMEQIKPDIVLTDIQMPIMSGLELVGRIKRDYPSVVSIILTGYAYFEYARECINHGVGAYLLKPINYDELRETFGKIIAELNKRNGGDNEFRLMQGKKQRLTVAMRKKFLKELLFVPLSSDEIIENAGLSEMTLAQGAHFIVAIVSLDKLKKGEIDYSEKDAELISYAFENYLDEFFEREPIGYFWVDAKACDVYCIFELKHADIELAAKKLESIRELLYEIRGLIKTTVSISVGSFQDNPTDVLVSAEAARAVNKGIQHDESFVFYDPTAYAINRDRFGRPAEDAGNDINLSAETGLHIINGAVTYINNNYTKVLTLDEVASAVHTNASYLSHLFKQATGINFISYLTKLRVLKAQELLRDPKLKIHDVSEAVGYESPRYFSMIFKKHVGVTPFKYRSQGAVQE